MKKLQTDSSDLHTFRPEYIKKLKKIDKEGKFNSFKNIGELRNAIEATE
jgi:hypothetical protein